MLFEKLMSECDIGLEDARKISVISVTYTWSGEQQRLRKGSEENFDMFCEIIGRAWEKGADRFNDGCKIEMRLHVGDSSN